DSIQLKIALGQVATSYRTSDNDSTTWHSNDYLVLMQPPTIMGPRSFVVNMGFADNSHLADTISVTLH
ncbi:MAG TPA: hypothetical protein VLD19_19080, partial [Chitinophagaceae bacterium]|nr:hypothetical protein [Chitinophagaceae bacterium]